MTNNNHSKRDNILKSFMLKSNNMPKNKQSAYALVSENNITDYLACLCMASDFCVSLVGYRFSFCVCFNKWTIRKSTHYRKRMLRCLVTKTLPSYYTDTHTISSCMVNFCFRESTKRAKAHKVVSLFPSIAVTMLRFVTSASLGKLWAQQSFRCFFVCFSQRELNTDNKPSRKAKKLQTEKNGVSNEFVNELCSDADRKLHSKVKGRN